MLFLRFLVLFAAARQRWPEYDVAKVSRAAATAVLTEDVTGTSRHLLLAMAAHESDLEPYTITFTVPDAVGKPSRVDVVLDGPEVAEKYPQRVFCGYLSAMAKSHAECDEMMRLDGGMLAGQYELGEWRRECRDAGHLELACALRGQAGGWRCAMNAASCSKPQHAQFAGYFVAVAEDLKRRERVLFHRELPAL